jgi:hypothetical protein
VYFQRTTQWLTAGLLVASVAGCGMPRQRPNSGVAVVLAWDSGPLDRDYNRQRNDMQDRHRREIESPRNDESSERRGERHEGEQRDLQRRYENGKRQHTHEMPPSDRDGRGDRP